jgi:nitrite reductase (NADH) small subunit
MSALTPRRWVEICALTDIPKLGSRVVAGPQGNIAVFRTNRDRLFALDDRCPHKGGPLSQGIVHGDWVACPLHNWQIGLDTGVARTPDEGCTLRHKVKAEGGRVWLWLDFAVAPLADSLAA